MADSARRVRAVQDMLAEIDRIRCYSTDCRGRPRLDGALTSNVLCCARRLASLNDQRISALQLPTRIAGDRHDVIGAHSDLDSASWRRAGERFLDLTAGSAASAARALVDDAVLHRSDGDGSPTWRLVDPFFADWIDRTLP